MLFTLRQRILTHEFARTTKALRLHLGHYFPGRNRTDRDLTEITARSRSCVLAMKYENV